MLSAQPESGGSAAPPIHVAIIMDGNGRWAKKRRLPRAMGHRAGAEAVRRAVESCISEGVRFLTLYAFSSENWKRPAEEVQDLMGLLKIYIQQEIDKLDENGVRLRFIGDRNRLSEEIIALIEQAENRTQGNRRLDLVIALNYGSRTELTQAMRDIAVQVQQGALEPQEISQELVSDHLETAGIPDPDLVIRTSGEQRLSNFLMWQAAYAELLFLDVLWPDFDETTMADAIHTYQKRERRFGAR